MTQSYYSRHYPLHAACEAKNFEKVQELVLVEKHDPNIRDFDSSTPLHEASCSGSLEIVQFLLDRNACPNAQADVCFKNCC
jgi:ankyrin repeat protein